MEKTENETLIELVKEEAINLRKNATKEEIYNLDFGSLNPDKINECVYGQMTGNCESKRANELIVECCKKVYSIDAGNHDNIFTNNKLNGKPFLVEQKTVFRNRLFQYVSPIEKFIYLNEGSGKSINNKILIDFLKGKSNELNFIN